jgi:hypothetical protein
MVDAAYDPTSASSPGVGFQLAAIGGAVLNFGSLLSPTNNFTAGASYWESKVVNAASETLQGISAWEMVVHDGSGSPDQGTFTLAISDPGPMVVGTSGAVAWTMPHGSLNIIEYPVMGSSATGTVTVQASF